MGSHKADGLLFQVFRLTLDDLSLLADDLFCSSGVEIPHMRLKVFMLNGMLYISPL